MLRRDLLKQAAMLGCVAPLAISISRGNSMTANVEHSFVTLNDVELHLAHRGAGAKRLMLFATSK